MSETTFKSTEARINTLLRDIHLSFKVSAGLFDISGRQLGYCGFETRSNFCRFIHFYDAKQICRQSYLQGFCQCAEEQKPLIYFCPFGLVNITFPIPGREQNPYFVTVGPLLYRKPDDNMVGNILNLNCMLKPRAREIRQYLGEIEVRSEAQVHSMTTIIENALKGVSFLLMQGSDAPKTESGEFSDSIQLWLRANPYHEDSEAFQTALNASLPRKPTGGMDYSSDDLEKLIVKISDFIFSAPSLPLMVHRSLKYLEFLMEFSRKSGVNLEQLFQPNGISIDHIIKAGDPKTLERYILKSNTLFLNSYIAHREVHNKDVIFRAMHYIRTHYNDISLREVAEYVNLHPNYFSNLFKRSTGQSYSHYLKKNRIEESKRLLMENYTLSEIAQKVGFADQSYFTNVFKKLEGISPYRWKNAQKEKEVPY